MRSKRITINDKMRGDISNAIGDPFMEFRIVCLKYNWGKNADDSLRQLMLDIQKNVISALGLSDGQEPENE